MKQKILKLFLMSIIAFTAYNCQKDDELITDDVAKHNISVEHISSNNLDRKTALKIEEKANIIQKNKATLNQQQKFEYNTDLGVYIDLDNGKLVNNNGNLYYTYPMYRESEDKLENIVFKPLDNGELETFFVKYNVTPKQFDELSTAEIQSLIPQFQKVTYDGPEYICVVFEYEVTVYGGCGETHSNGYTCEEETTTYTSSFCNWTTGGGFGFDSDSGGFENNQNDSSNQNNDSTSGNYNGGGNGSDTITTTPIPLQPWEEVDICLNQISDIGTNSYTQEMLDWLQAQPKSIAGQLNDILQTNSCSQFTQQNIIIIIEAMMSDSSLTFEEIISDNILITDAEQSEKIEDINKELECFDTSLPAQLTVYAEQAIENSREVTTALGHSFISISQGNTTRSIGYYATSRTGAALGSSASELHDNSNSPYHVSITLDISATQLANIINYIKNAPQTYVLNTYNCTDFAIGVAAEGGLTIPLTVGTYGLFFEGRNPSDMGQDMRELILPTGATRDSNGGNAPSRTPDCP